MQAVRSSKLMLEKELQEVISLTSQELEEYREKVLELEDEVIVLPLSHLSCNSGKVPRGKEKFEYCYFIPTVQKIRTLCRKCCVCGTGQLCCLSWLPFMALHGFMNHFSVEERKREG